VQACRMNCSAWAFSAVTALALFGVFACSSSSDSGNVGTLSASDSSVTEYCNAHCAADCVCAASSCPQGSPDARCLSQCNSDYRTRAPRVRDIWLRNVTSCIRDHLQSEGDSGAVACSEIQSDCSKHYVLADSAFPNIPVIQKCQGLATKLTAPGGQNCADEGFVPNKCNQLATLTDQARADADAACLGGDKTCRTLETCLDQAMGN